MHDSGKRIQRIKSWSDATLLDRREDTSFKLAHFKRHKRKSLKKTPGKSSTYPFHMPEQKHDPGKDSTNKIVRLIGKATNYVGLANPRRSKRRKVAPSGENLVTIATGLTKFLQ